MPILLDQIFRQFYKQLKSFIVSRVQDSDTADDILQDVFLKVHAKIDTLKDDTKLQSWLYQITRNAIIDYYRTKKQTEQLPEDIASDIDPETDDEKLLESVHSFIEQLPAPYREALTLTEMEGMTQKEYALHSGLSLPGAKSRVQRGRKMLKELLLECCHFEFDRYGTVLDYHPNTECECCTTCNKN